MQNTVKRFVLGLFAVAPLALVSSAEPYKCTTASGCSARIVSGGQQFEFTFSQGDVVDTGARWIVNESDGWTRF